MKYHLPTGHWIYFCAQVKKDKIDSTGSSGGKNVSTVLTQARMAIDHPIFDPETNRKVLVDHVFVISAGQITRAAREWLIGQLDAGQRRHIIFMDREEFLDQAARILLDLRIDTPAAEIDDSDIYRSERTMNVDETERPLTSHLFTLKIRSRNVHLTPFRPHIATVSRRSSCLDS